MADIPASMVMKLRKMSGQGMMDCKRALQDSDGDLDKAMEILRKKGLATLSKRAARETSEGLVVCSLTDDGKEASMATLCCETDFVAKSDDFKAAATLLADYAKACTSAAGAEDLLKTEMNGKSYSDVLTETVSKTGEKTEVGDYAKVKVEGSGLIGTYIHFNGKVGSMVAIEASSDDVAASEEIKQVAGDIAMHIAAAKPLAVNKDGLDPKVVEQEKAIFADQVKDKPAQIIDKIVEGKMGKYYAENCLIAQPFVKDDSQTVEQVLNETAKKAGGKATIREFVRFSVD